jgi:hypothetical protein
LLALRGSLTNNPLLELLGYSTSQRPHTLTVEKLAPIKVAIVTIKRRMDLG